MLPLFHKYVYGIDRTVFRLQLESGFHQEPPSLLLPSELPHECGLHLPT